MSAATRTGPGVRFFILSHLAVALLGIVLGGLLVAGGGL
jgi:hypothetical protein